MVPNVALMETVTSVEDVVVLGLHRLRNLDQVLAVLVDRGVLLDLTRNIVVVVVSVLTLTLLRSMATSTNTSVVTLVVGTGKPCVVLSVILTHTYVNNALVTVDSILLSALLHSW